MKSKNSIWFKISIASFILTAIFVIIMFFIAQGLVKEARKEVLPKTQINKSFK